MTQEFDPTNREHWANHFRQTTTPVNPNEIITNENACRELKRGIPQYDGLSGFVNFALHPPREMSLAVRGVETASAAILAGAFAGTAGPDIARGIGQGLHDLGKTIDLGVGNIVVGILPTDWHWTREGLGQTFHLIDTTVSQFRTGTHDPVTIKDTLQGIFQGPLCCTVNLALMAGLGMGIAKGIGNVRKWISKAEKEAQGQTEKE